MFQRHLPKPTLLFIFLGICLLTGCAALQPVPTKDLGVFKQSLAETRVVGEQVLQTFSKAARETKAWEKANKDAANKLPYPTAFNALEILKTDQEPDHVAVRLLAFETLERYTDLLVTLAEGKSVEQVQDSAEQLRVNLQTITGLLNLAPVPGLAAAGNLIQTLAGALERARIRQEFIDAVKEGEPVASKILDFLIMDTTDSDDAKGYYTIVLAIEEIKRGKLRRKISEAGGSIIRIVNDHEAPTDSELIPGLQERMDVVLASFTPPPNPDELPILKSEGTAQFSNLAQSQVMTEMDAMEAFNRDKSKIMEGLNAYHALLSTYVRLLSKTKINLKQLSMAIDRPVDVQAAFESTLRLALQARRELRIVQDSL